MPLLLNGILAFLGFALGLLQYSVRLNNSESVDEIITGQLVLNVEQLNIDDTLASMKAVRYYNCSPYSMT